jgi:hypothetical protein
MDYKLKKKLLSTEMSFWRGAVRAPKLVKVKKKKKSSDKKYNTIWGRTSKQYAETVWTRSTQDHKRWTKRIMTWSPAGR